MLIKFLAALAYVVYGFLFDFNFITVADVVAEVWVLIMLLLISVLIVIQWKRNEGDVI